MTPITPTIGAAWYAGELSAQTQAALTVSTPVPAWLWLGIGIGLVTGIILVMAVDLWRTRRASTR